MTPVKLALIGLGRMGRVHASALATLDLMDVVVVADPHPATPEHARKFFPRAETVSSYTDAVQRVEACLIVSPTPLHPEMVGAALDAGVHVLCEKPLSLQPSVARELANRANDLGKILQIGHWRRFSPPWREAKRLVASGAIGTPVWIRLSQWDANPPPASFCDPAVSGGLAVDCGVHEYDLAEWLFDERACAVRAWNLPLVDRSLAEVGDVDNLCAVLEFPSGRTAVVDLSRNSRYGDDVRTEILGEQGAVFVDLLPHGQLRVATGDGVRVVSDGHSSDATLDGVRRQAEVFAQIIRGAAHPYPNGIDSARSTLIGLAVAESAREKRTVQL